MTWKSSNGAASPKSGGASSSRYGPEPALQRLVRLVAEEGGVHAFIHRATADQGVVEEARALTRTLLGGQDIPEPCRQLCQRFGVGESLLRARLWAVASLFPDRQSATSSPYEILGVEPWSEQDDIKRAFRALCLKWHPDHNQDDPEAVTRFRQIKAAYDMVNDHASAQGWGPPAGLNVWQEPGPSEEKRAWPRLRRLAPLAMVVGLMVLAVGFADLVVHYPRPKSASRETTRNGKALPDTKLPAGEDGAHQVIREPLVLPGATPGQTAVATVVKPEAPAPGGGTGSGAEKEPSPGLGDVAGRQDVAAQDAKSGDDQVGRATHEEAAVESATASGPFGGAGSVQAPAGLPVTGTAHSRGELPEARGAVSGGLASEAPKAVGMASKPAAPGGVVAGKPAAVESATASGPFGGAGSVQAPAGLPVTGTAHSGGELPEARGAVSGGLASEAPKAVEVASKPAAPGGAVAGKPANAAGRGGLGTSPELAGKGGNPVHASAQPQKQRREPSLEPAPSLSSPPAEPSPPARDALAAESPPANGDASMVDLRDVEERLETFLASYVRDYSRRDLAGFMRHFAPSALENGTPLEALHALYEENFRNIPTMRYSIMVDTVSVGVDRVSFEGRFELRGAHADGQPIASRGTLNMDLEPFETTFRVRTLEYSFR